MSESPTQRTLRHLRTEGEVVGIVEKWNQYGGGGHGIRQDLFGILDLVCLRPGTGIVGIQCCAGSGHAAHKQKILTTEFRGLLIAPVWLACCGRIEIWSWSKRKFKLASGKWSNAFRWTPRVEEITQEDFE